MYIELYILDELGHESSESVVLDPGDNLLYAKESLLEIIEDEYYGEDLDIDEMTYTINANRGNLKIGFSFICMNSGSVDNDELISEMKLKDIIDLLWLENEELARAVIALSKENVTLNNAVEAANNGSVVTFKNRGEAVDYFIEMMEIPSNAMVTSLIDETALLDSVEQDYFTAKTEDGELVYMRA